MVEVLGRPVIDFVKDAMVDAGVEHLVVTTGYRGEQLSAHVEQWSTHSGISARINQEAMPMGTAGSVRLLLDELTDTFVVGSGDAVASFDIQALIEAHRSHGAKVTMALWEVEDPTEFGIVGLSETHQGELDGELRQGFIRQFKEKPTLKKRLATSSMQVYTFLSQKCWLWFPKGKSLILASNCFQWFSTWVGQCTLRRSTECGLMSATRLN